MSNDLYTLPIAHERCLETYFQEINRYPLLKPKQEVELALLVRDGDEDALHQLVRANLRFVVSVAKQYAGRGLLLSDLINEGNLGMMKSAHRFDVDRGFRFISYAVWWVRQSITRALKDTSRIVRLPQSQIKLLSRIRKAQEQLKNEGNPSPHAEQVAELIGESVTNVRVVTQADQVMLPLESHGEDGDQRSLADSLPAKNQPAPDARLVEESRTIDLELMLVRVTEREAEILRCYFGLGREDPQTLQQIGDEIGLTRERVRQIKEKALEKLRRSHHPDHGEVRRKPH